MTHALIVMISVGGRWAWALGDGRVSKWQCDRSLFVHTVLYVCIQHTRREPSGAVRMCLQRKARCGTNTKCVVQRMIGNRARAEAKQKPGPEQRHNNNRQTDRPDKRPGHMIAAVRPHKAHPSIVRFHTMSLLFMSRSSRSSGRMTRVGLRGDILGSVASCPGLRVQYW
jgi:hypothetical protein